MTIERRNGDEFYISDGTNSNIELIKNSHPLLTKSTQILERQTSSATCYYQQNGHLRKFVKIPKEYPSDKLVFEMRETINSYPDANYIMSLDFADAKVERAKIHNENLSFFNKDLQELLSPYYSSVCEKQYIINLNTYIGSSGSSTLALPNLDVNQLEFLTDSSYTNYNGVKRKQNQLYKLGDRIFIRRGHSSKLDNRLISFFKNNLNKKFLAHERTNDYVDGYTFKYIPSADPEHINISIINGNLILHWIRKLCSLDVKIQINGIDQDNFYSEDTQKIPLNVTSIDVNSIQLSSDKNCYNSQNFYQALSDISKNSNSNFILEIEPSTDYYTNSFSLIVRKKGSAEYYESQRFIPITK